MSRITGWLKKAKGSVSVALSPRRSGKSSAIERLEKSPTVTDDCTCSHRRTIHYYGGPGVTEHCLVFGCPCVLY